MGSQFLPNRCAVIDRVGSNVLLRGNMPLLGEDNHYALREMQAASGQADLLSRTIVDVPIIDNAGERVQFEALCEAFGVPADRFTAWPPYGTPDYDPNEYLGVTLRTEGVEVLGAMVWRPFEGLPAGEDPTTYLGAPLWDFGGFIDNVIHMLSQLEQAAVYVHCQLGADRTGAFHIGYLMKAHGLSFRAAWATANAATQAGPPNADYQRLVTAYGRTL